MTLHGNHSFVTRTLLSAKYRHKKDASVGNISFIIEHRGVDLCGCFILNLSHEVWINWTNGVPQQPTDA